MKKALIIIGITGIVGVGGWFAFKNWKKKKDAAADAGDSPLLPEETKSNSTSNTAQSKSESYTYNAPAEDYKSKVKRLQTLLKVTSDGAVGPKTMAALNKYFAVSTLSSSNIDRLIKQVDLVSGAINSLAFRVKDTPKAKAQMWDYWVKKINESGLGLKFDPNVTKAYIAHFRRSLYTDYANREVPKTYQPYRAFLGELNEDQISSMI
jgi:hypothetical protein